MDNEDGQIKALLTSDSDKDLNEGFRLLLQKYGGAMQRKVWKTSGGKVDADEVKEVIQLSLLGVYENISKGKYYKGRSLKAYVLTVTRNQCLKFMRDRTSKNNPAAPRSLPMGEESGEIADVKKPVEEEGIERILERRIQLIYQCLDELPEEHRKLFTLRHNEGKSVRETAKEMNRDDNWVKVNFYRLRHRVMGCVALKEREQTKHNPGND